MVVPVVDHHDSFLMYKSDLSEYNTKYGPKRDVLGELSEAFPERALKNCASSHRAAHWFFMGHGKEFNSDKGAISPWGSLLPSIPESDYKDIFSEPKPKKEYLEDWLLRNCENLDQFSPKLIYLDWWIEHNSFKPYLKKFDAYYYNRAIEWGEEVAVSYKHDAFISKSRWYNT